MSEELLISVLHAAPKVNRYLTLLLAPVLRKMIFSIRSTEYGTRALYSATEREDKALLQGLLNEGVLGFVGNRVPPNEAVVS